MTDRTLGKIRCRFPNASKELREMGSFLRDHQTHDFQPFFRISEAQREQTAINKVITPEKIAAMIQYSQFEMGIMQIHVSDKLGPTTIALGLQDRETRRDEVIPISGFPCPLIVNSLHKGKFHEMAHGTTTNNSLVPSMDNTERKVRRNRTTRRSRHGIDNGLHLFDADDKSGHRRTDSSTSSTSEGNVYPSGPDDVNDWISRRARAAMTPRRSVAVPPEPHSPDPQYRSPTSSERSSIAASLGASFPLDTLPSYPDSLPSYPVPAGVFELPAEEEDPEDEDERQLQQAIAESLRTSELAAGHEANNRLTMGGTNLDELAAAISISKVIR